MVVACRTSSLAWNSYRLLFEAVPGPKFIRRSFIANKLRSITALVKKTDWARLISDGLRPLRAQKGHLAILLSFVDHERFGKVGYGEQVG